MVVTAWGAFVVIATVASFVAAIFTVATSRPRWLSVGLLALVGTLTLVTVQVLRDNAAANAGADALSDVQQRAQAVDAELFSQEASAMSQGTNKGNALAVMSFLEYFEACRPSARSALEQAIEDARARESAILAEVPDQSDLPLSALFELGDLWEDTAETAHQALRAVVAASPGCGHP